MRESRLTIPKEWMEQMWQGYRCAACLERFTEAYPKECPICRFQVAELQRRRLEEDFVGEVERMKQEGWVEREEAILEEHFHKPKVQIVRP